jgi:hypothetical protein
MDVRIDFDSLPWQLPLPGLRFKAFVRGAQQVRLVEFSPGFVEPDWCRRPHSGRVLEGSLVLRFPDGSEQRLAAGDDLFIDDSPEQAHIAVLGPDESARLLLFEPVPSGTGGDDAEGG